MTPSLSLLPRPSGETAACSARASAATPVRLVEITDYPTSGATPSVVTRCSLDECVALDLTPGSLRFASVRLEAQNDSMNVDVAVQIGAQLWSVLEEPDVITTPRDFRERHILRSPHGLAVWNRRGMVFGYRDEKGRAIAETARGHVERLAAIHNAIGRLLDPSGSITHEERVNRGETLLIEVLAIECAATLPEHRLLRRFLSATGSDRLLKSVYGLHLQASTHQFARSVHSSVEAMQAMQCKAEWVEVFLISVYSIYVFHYVGENLNFTHAYVGWSIIVGSPLAAAVALWKLQPGRHSPAARNGACLTVDRRSPMAVAKEFAPVIVMLVIYLILGLLFAHH